VEKVINLACLKSKKSEFFSDKFLFKVFPNRAPDLFSSLIEISDSHEKRLPELNTAKTWQRYKFILQLKIQIDPPKRNFL